MAFSLHQPDPAIADLVDCFWVVEEDDATPGERKIIPDGYPELIFHYGDPYEIRLMGDWERQPRCLAAGQITRYFFLRNTGRSGMIGVKLQPWGLAQLCGLPMVSLKDRVVALAQACDASMPIESAVMAAHDTDGRMAALTGVLRRLDRRPPPEALSRAVAMIFKSHGTLPVSELCAACGVNERSLERAFARHVGLSPKFYSRLVRFSAIFRAVSGEGPCLSELSVDAGYYDQPHFHRDFKKFTGENPSEYAFGRASMANLFLGRQ